MNAPNSVRRLAGAFLFPLLVSGAAATAQDAKPAAVIAPAPAPKQQGQDELKELRKKKLAKPVFERAAWRLDFDAAKQEAKASGQLLLVYFTRSYAH